MEKVEQSVSAKLFLIDPYFNARGQFAGRWWAGHWRRLREAQIPYALEEFTVKIPRNADILLLDCPPWMFHGATSNPLLAMSHIASTLRGFLPRHPLLRKGGVVICATPCDGTIDDWYRPSDREAISLYARVGRDVGELFDRYSEDFLNRPEYIYKYRFCYGHHRSILSGCWRQNSTLLTNRQRSSSRAPENQNLCGRWASLRCRI